MNRFQNLHQAISNSLLTLKINGKPVKTDRWQGTSVEETAKGKMWELLHHRFESPMPPSIEIAKQLIQPNLPWADDHFQERISGIPSNPGEAYKHWPYYPKGNDTNIRKEVFTHTYQERIWPKFAGYPNPIPFNRGGTLYDEDQNTGIRYNYGDLDDLINLLKRDPMTRQAFLPIWFPEDTGAVHGGRVPCSIGYWFVIRDGKLNVEYTIRAVDAIRHFRDDVYFCFRLAKHVMDQFNCGESFIELGDMIMNTGSFHVFHSERNLL